MSVLAKVQYFGRTAGQGLWHAPFIHFVAVVTLAIALFTFGLARGASAMLEGLIKGLGGEVQLTAYLKTGLSTDDAAEVVDILKTKPGIQASVVTPKEALGRLRQELGDEARVLADVRDNPLPTSIEVRLAPGVRDLATLRGLAEGLRRRPEVAEVDFGEEAVARLTALSRALRLAALTLMVVVMTATIVIVSATLQLAIYARREEVEIQKLVGATNRFVKAPFLLEGIFQGVLGAACALLGLWAFFTYAGPRIGTLFSFLKVASVVSPLGLTLAGEVMGLGVLLGLFGSFVAVGRFLKV